VTIVGGDAGDLDDDAAYGDPSTWDVVMEVAKESPFAKAVITFGTPPTFSRGLRDFS
jgi:hypothetical protein